MHISVEFICIETLKISLMLLIISAAGVYAAVLSGRIQSMDPGPWTTTVDPSINHLADGGPGPDELFMDHPF